MATDIDYLPPIDSAFVHCGELICRSYTHWIGDVLVESADSGQDLIHSLYFADFVLLAHDNTPDPVLNFCNAAALRLWEYDRRTLLSMPSRLTAEPDCRDDRARVLEEVRTRGYSSNYSGIRISRTGRRFQIRNAIVWNVLDEQYQHRGQAAMFRDWSYLSG